MSSGDIEDALRRRRDERRALEDREAAIVARRTAAGAEAARGFIDLMTRRGVAPEPVYRHEQVRIRGKLGLFGRRPDTSVERFEHVDRGWVISYSITEYDDPWLIKYLRADGLIADCDLRAAVRGGRGIEGLVPPPSRTIFGANRVLILKPHAAQPPTTPFLTVDSYAAAAERYLGVG